MSMLEGLLSKKKKLAVIGLGYVGLPIALEFARKIRVVGFDINQKRIEMMKRGEDPSNEIQPEEFKGRDITFTSSADDLKDVSFFIIAVPTPVDEHKVPDLRPVLGASETVGKVLSQGSYVVYESTVYPGCTEEDCLPILEKRSGLKCRTGFKLGYSPERINPGDREHTLPHIIKVVSGCDEEALDTIAKVYGIVVQAGVFRASSIKVAEAAKIIENTQRDVNIALMNELSIIFDKIGINTYEVLDAANTKWNFLNFSPGLVGGHCIGVDPYYLTYKAIALGYEPEVILSGRNINDGMGAYVARKTVQLIIRNGKSAAAAKVLVMGATFKENVTDIRNSKVADIVRELRDYSVNVEVTDACASGEEVAEEYDFTLVKKIGSGYDAVIVAVGHDDYLKLDESWFGSICNGKGVLVDLKGLYRGKIKKLTYWSL